VATDSACETARTSAPSFGTPTRVELTWLEKKTEYWLRFSREVECIILDRRRRVVAVRPGSIFAFVRWAANDYGTVVSRLDIVRAVAPDEPFQTLPFVRPGGDLLLNVEGWPRVERVLQLIDAIEALGIDPVDVPAEHWRHVHNRLAAGHEPRRYTRAHHYAATLRRKVGR
jgi:hypothetical protein